MSDVALTSFLNLTSSLQHLSLRNCELHGEFPAQVFQLPNLKQIDLAGNENLTEPSSIRYVDLSYNCIGGPIPDSIFELVNLTVLDLSSNNLSGVIKPDMLLKLTSLEDLDVSNNSLLSLSTSGNDVNYSFPQLKRVLFSSCNVRQFSNFFRSSKMEVLDLSNNKISGGISKWEAEGWEELQVLNLSHNILTTLEQFPGKSLRILDLQSNLLQGQIPSLQIRNPYVFSISKNKLTGNIPSSICNWSSLVILDLSKNNLSGTIPDCLGNLSSLKFMDLQVNNVYGKIPDCFANNELTHLILSDNRLEGLVPPSLVKSTSLEVLNLENNKLTGRLPHWLTSLLSLQVLILRCNRFHGSLSDSITLFNVSVCE
ncbi:hypothetical protein J1N35_012599 [Gossypium stocksii]|uniref:Uncharacterized protein n=1 Tax=Gossypium stocksii TaxID=47602 RepID=A0A9D3W4W0_9ROSI|nr:hypothetical protein J1N35_012599 [Gossypium stocksii]